jgi:exonuclease SbcC
MITIHKIEAQNIRALGHAVFEPLVDGGMTAVNGPNGAGKSSILTALLWALYGVTPDGVQQTAMRRQGSVDACRVVVDFEYNGQIVTVERGLKGRNDSPYLIITVNGMEQAKGSIKAGTAWLVNLLGGLDAEAFMTAFVIRQKELDGLVKAKPAERRKLIERLAGIDRMSTAVKSAREEESEVKKRLDLLPGDNDALEAARKDLDDAQQAAVDLWEAYETAEAVATEVADALTAAEADATAMQARLDAHAEAERDLTAAKHALAMAQQAVMAARGELDQARTAAQGGSPEDVEAAQVAYTQATEAVTANQQAREGADRAVQSAAGDAARETTARQRAEAARVEADRVAVAAREAAQRAASFPADLPAQASAAEQELADAQARTGALRAEYDRLTPSIKAMEATGGKDSCCPTCATVLPDPALVLTTLRESQARAVTEGKAAAAQVQQIEARLRSLREQGIEAAAAREGAAQMAERATTAEQQAVAAKADADEISEQARVSREAAETAKAAAMSAAQQTGALKAAVTEASEALRVAQVAAAAAARVPDLNAALAQASDRHTAAEEAFTAAELAEVAQRVPAAERDAVLAAHRSAQQASMLAGTRNAEAHGNFRVAEEQVKSAERARDAEELKMRARAETFALLEQKTAVREALDFFRKDRIASLAPELSEIATDLIAKMTDGKFVAVELDEEFTPVVTDAQGRLRPASWLSGGEESAVALALRLAIGEVIAGSKGGLLWMDEPQTAMDAQRRPAMMSVLRDLNGRQVIIISHVTEATDMVDLVIDVVPNDEDGSTVTAARSLHDIEDTAALDAIA